MRRASGKEEAVLVHTAKMGYYWPTTKKDVVGFAKKCHSCQMQANLIHTHPQSLHSMITPCPFHTWGLDLVELVNQASHRYIWILVAIEYYSVMSLEAIWILGLPSVEKLSLLFWQTSFSFMLVR